MKKLRNLKFKNDLCRLCRKFKESVIHLISGCEKFAESEYLIGHDNILMIMATESVKSKSLVIENAKWFELSWTKETVLENNRDKLNLDFEFKTRKRARARRPDLLLEDLKDRKFLLLTCLALWMKKK